MEVLRGGLPAMSEFAVATVVTLVAALALIGLAGRMLQRERAVLA
jgi:hypothetical protein